MSYLDIIVSLLAIYIIARMMRMHGDAISNLSRKREGI